MRPQHTAPVGWRDRLTGPPHCARRHCARARMQHVAWPSQFPTRTAAAAKPTGQAHAPVEVRVAMQISGAARPTVLIWYVAPGPLGPVVRLATRPGGSVTPWAGREPDGGQVIDQTYVHGAAAHAPPLPSSLTVPPAEALMGPPPVEMLAGRGGTGRASRESFCCGGGAVLVRMGAFALRWRVWRARFNRRQPNPTWLSAGAVRVP
jgi:hypothetical protein